MLLYGMNAELRSSCATRLSFRVFHHHQRNIMKSCMVWVLVPLAVISSGKTWNYNTSWTASLLEHWGWWAAWTPFCKRQFSNAFPWVKMFCILIRITCKCVPKGPIDNKSTLVQAMAWRQTGLKLLVKSMMTQFIDTHMHHWASMH